MKIGIITFHEAANYGAVLQTYALQKYLDKIGIDNEIINYRCDTIYNMYVPYSKQQIKGIYDFFKSIVRYNIRREKQKRFQYFVANNIRLNTKTALPKKELMQNELSQYDMILVGSDQVWNPYITCFDTTYFLDFVPDNIKKGSYASSFGIEDLPKEYKSQVQNLLKRFDYLSVREEQGKKIVDDLLDNKTSASVVIDPTLLLTKKDWFWGEEKCDYILLYLLENSKTAKKYACDLARKTDLPIYCISDTLIKDIKAKYITKATPEEWVILFKNAKYVVTNSFHGIVFSLNFNVSFFVDLLKSGNKTNSRIVNLLNQFNLKERQISNIDLLQYPDIKNWKSINEKMSVMRQESYEYLWKICNLENE